MRISLHFRSIFVVRFSDGLFHVKRGSVVGDGHYRPDFCTGICFNHRTTPSITIIPLSRPALLLRAYHTTIA
ncbi:MAG: hypothetical protein WEB58_08250 [Planctomycetaceae bacterium]